jgi:hypothetical protein
MKLTDLDCLIISEAKIERARLKALMAELSNEALAKALGISVGCVNNYLCRPKKRQPRMSRLKALELARQIKERKVPTALFRVELGWGICPAANLRDEDLADDGFIGIYDSNVNWRTLFEHAG